MHATHYVVKVQNPRTGYWDEVSSTPVDYIKETRSHRFLWFWTAKQTIITNEREALKAAREKAWLVAYALHSEGKTVRIDGRWPLLLSDNSDGTIDYEAWRNGKWTA